jgi:acetyltransferase
MPMLQTSPAVHARLRVMRPGDTPAVLAFYEGLGRRSLRCRFHGAVNGEASARLRGLADLAALPQRDAQAVVATVRVNGGERVIGHAVWRRTGDARAEFGIVVADGWQRCGIGRRLLAALVAGAARQGVAALQAEVQDDNLAMQALVRPLGMGLHADTDDASLLRVCIPVMAHSAPGAVRRAWASIGRWVVAAFGVAAHAGRLA